MTVTVTVTAAAVSVLVAMRSGSFSQVMSVMGRVPGPAVTPVGSAVAPWSQR